MIKSKEICKLIILLIKCYIIILILGFGLPKLLGVILEMFMKNCNTYNNSTLVFNLLNEKNNILCYYKYIIEMYFSF
ncbi:hypothetical protein ADU90_04765 [Clostridium botulinum]|uniref:Uncharacterized protein n=1 Tax=Clostridium botulinum C/D str. DC5 TaxID=1443128 RepID=A0A0A0IP24_CLOBO|nr:hypothetical protein Z952_02270 [Clostridium botulinum C/D str. BKT75002]KEI12159.1 hypothetical protein Z954_06415 [Clostridium botulinum C/D str. BKT2873]KGM96844.1 hypothetical protein Z956_02125 [Clostridium botulinum D str. CCUG 7971]KGN01942.1 hypothetical protein Z955_00650 [Clostridium botulinum C/D str. DC5]KOC48579.1 hypothetical protein ADU88_08185 [Clostridium botulinum]MCD3232725.1 hypothetical protein [Clostridium botulinum D/C]